MARHQIPPSLADLSQEFAGNIPVNLIRSWVQSDKSETTHYRMLEPFIIKGTVVSSDSSGLSKLSQTNSVLQVSKLISQPKEIIYQYGKKINGRPLGVWVADNTCMFYDNTISAESILRQMVAAQQEIKNLCVHVGMGIHSADFIELGGGLFGSDAYVVEEMTENYTDASEIALSHSFKLKLPLRLRTNLRQRDDLDFAIPFYTVDYSKTIRKPRPAKSSDYLFPIPFDVDFYKKLRMLEPENVEKSEELYSAYSQQQIVILVKVIHTGEKLLLNQLTNWILASAIVNQSSMDYNVQRIKSNGNLAILVASDSKSAVAFARDVRAYLLEAGYQSRIALASGEVLVFNLPDKGKDITGNPVNIASKLAEDAGETGKIYLHESVDHEMRSKRKQFFNFIVSQVELKGYEI